MTWSDWADVAAIVGAITGVISLGWHFFNTCHRPLRLQACIDGYTDFGVPKEISLTNLSKDSVKILNHQALWKCISEGDKQAVWTWQCKKNDTPYLHAGEEKKLQRPGGHSVLSISPGDRKELVYILELELMHLGKVKRHILEVTHAAELG